MKHAQNDLFSLKLEAEAVASVAEQTKAKRPTSLRDEGFADEGFMSDDLGGLSLGDFGVEL